MGFKIIGAECLTALEVEGAILSVVGELLQLKHARRRHGQSEINESLSDSNQISLNLRRPIFF